MAPDRSAPGDEAVTVIARHTVLPGHDAEFETWIAGITEACRRFEGYLATEVIRPVDPEHREYVSIFRFDDYAHLEAWMDSPQRRSWLVKAESFSATPPSLSRYRSLDFWFESKKSTGGPPPRHKMAVVTFAVIWPLVHFIPSSVAAVLPGPRLLSEGVSVLVIVLLMTYVVMPTATRVAARWLFGRSPG